MDQQVTIASSSDITGCRFGRLTATGPDTRSLYWKCLCDCGNTKSVLVRSLVGGRTRSCGCLQREQLGDRRRTHGASGTVTWRRWRAMISRCTMKNSKSYPRYGGRGIKVSAEWLRSFETFLADMGECPGLQYTVERDDNELGYSAANCRWATRKEQNRNTSRNHLLEYRGETLCVTEWAEVLGINVRTIMTRLSKGWATEVALGTPVAPHKPRKQSGRST